MTVRDVRTFFLLTFAVSWGVGILFVLFHDQVERIFGPMRYTNPVFILMVYTPGIIAGPSVVPTAALLADGSVRCVSGRWDTDWCITRKPKGNAPNESDARGPRIEPAGFAIRIVCPV